MWFMTRGLNVFSGINRDMWIYSAHPQAEFGLLLRLKIMDFYLLRDICV